MKAPVATGYMVEHEPHWAILRCPNCRALHKHRIQFGLLHKPPCGRGPCYRIVVQVGGAK